MARNSDYDTTALPGALSMTKVKNAFKKVQPDLALHISNVRINGQLRGCSGFVENRDTGRIVYFRAEQGTYLGSYLIRNAAHVKDYNGGRNRQCPQSLNNLVDAITKLLESKDLS